MPHSFGAMAGSLDKDAATAKTPEDSYRMRALAGIMKQRGPYPVASRVQGPDDRMRMLTERSRKEESYVSTVRPELFPPSKKSWCATATRSDYFACNSITCTE